MSKDKPLITRKTLKEAKKWLNTEIKQSRSNSLTLIFVGLIMECAFWSITHSCTANCGHVYKEIGRLEAENKVCTGGFNEGLKSVFLDHFGIIIWGVCIAFVFHGVGFHIVRVN